MNQKTLSLNDRTILSMINTESSVLDLGCGDGTLLEHLISEKKCRCHGIEIDEQAIYKCVAKGLNVIHQDIDSGLGEYNDKSFNYVILNQSIQQIKNFESVLIDSLRVGEKVIVSFPNFAFYKSRFQLFFNGRTPITESLPYRWYQSPNIHFFTIYDFIDFCREKNIIINNRFFINNERPVRFLPNFFCQIAVFMISIN